MGTQEALKAALEAAKQVVTSLAVALSSTQPQPIPLVNAPELQSLLTIRLAMCVSASIIDALAVHPVSSSSVVASAAAMAAAVARVTH